MKIVLVGLPYFSNRLQKELTCFDKSNSYIRLDTYGSRWDQLKALWHIPRADCLFSINGTITKSRAFDVAFSNKVPLIINWAGTDVIKATKAYKEGNFQQHYIDKPTHFCESTWIQEELSEIGINAELVYFATAKTSLKPEVPDSTKLSILAYIPNHRSDFYGMPTFLKTAKEHKDVNFILVGSNGDNHPPLPDNIEALGWVDNMDDVFAKIHATMRFLEHDGISNIVRESLGRGKQVLYKYPFDNCIHCPTEEKLIEEIGVLKKRLSQGEDLTNFQGFEFIQNEFNEEKVLSRLIEKIEAVVEK